MKLFIRVSQSDKIYTEGKKNASWLEKGGHNRLLFNE